MKKKTRNVIGTLVIIAVLGFLISSSIINSYKYYYTVDEVILKAGNLANKDIKIAGNVKKGSVVMQTTEAAVVFVLSGDQKEIAVEYKGQIPDTFSEGIPVVVEGTLIEGGPFKARSLLTKCASKYEEQLKQ